jgi:RNA polymerase subunit RPABC4/transcription elongation factor Spt4
MIQKLEKKSVENKKTCKVCGDKSLFFFEKRGEKNDLVNMYICKNCNAIVSDDVYDIESQIDFANNFF